MPTREAAGVRMHADQVTVSLGAVRELVAAQFPSWRDLPVRQVASQGTVNAIFRIGDELSARFPLRSGGVDEVRQWLELEAGAAAELLGRTRFPTPEPVAIGSPGAGYPLPWSVQTWVPGVPAIAQDPGGSVAFARDLAEFIDDVRGIPTRGRRFTGTGRGGELRSHDAWMHTCFQRSERLLDVPRLRRLWNVMRDLPRGESSDVMTHGDLVPGNVLVRGDELVPGSVPVSAGRLAGVIDVGGLGPADPALDLVAAWHLLEAGPRRALREQLSCDDDEWDRGRAWAFEQAMGLVWYYVESNPAMCRMGRRTLERILAEV